MEAGMLSEAAILSSLVSYSLWTVRDSATERRSLLEAALSIEFPFDSLVFLALAVLVLSVAAITILDEDTASSTESFDPSSCDDATNGMYLFEAEPAVKAALVALTTNVICVVTGYFHNVEWLYWRALQIIVVTAMYAVLLYRKSDNTLYEFYN